MGNGQNNWDVGYSSITFFEKMHRNHNNVTKLERSFDILFSVTRRKQSDCVKVAIVNTYTFGVADFYKVTDELNGISCIVLAGDWNYYTLEAKELTLSENVGLFTPQELVAALWQEKPHTYFTKDSNGNPIYHTRAA